MNANVEVLASMRDINAYNRDDAEIKARFHTRGKAFLKALADSLLMSPGSFEVRSNKAGIAVSGEITLHHERVYVQIVESCVGGGVSIMFRSCKGRKDYTGGHNQWAHMRDLRDAAALEGFVSRVKKAMMTYY